MVNQGKPVVAMFGGSFDPPHLGHQQIVEKALKTLKIERLLIVPAFLNPFKHASLASPSQRLEWCHTLFDPIPKVVVDDYEIKEGRSTTTVQSLKYFSVAYTVRYLIVGSDNLATLTQWKDFAWINAHVVWIIVTREGHALKTQMLREWRVLSVDRPVSSTQIRDHGIVSHVDQKIKKSVKNILEGQPPMTLDERVETIVQILDEKKAEEIESFNLEDADYIADRVIIANSLNTKHTVALYEHLKTALKAKGEAFFAVDISDEWIVADLGDILIHIMVPEYRQRYSLEQFLSELAAKQKA